MTLERARKLICPKIWGVDDLRPWSSEVDESCRIGEISFERSAAQSPPTGLLLKLLFTSAPLSIQVHPDDAYAKSIGLPNGKSEAWYVLSAKPGAEIGLGLSQTATREQLRDAIEDGSIASLIDWQPVQAQDAFSVPAGTIHAIGAGVVIAEIQQRSDATFRIFDYGRRRELQVDAATSMAALDPPAVQARPEQLSPERLLLAANSHFTFERLELAPDSNWLLDASRETWLLVLNGAATAGSHDLVQGDVVFAESEHLDIAVGLNGSVCLVAYMGGAGPTQQLLQRIGPIDQKLTDQGAKAALMLSIGMGS